MAVLLSTGLSDLSRELGETTTDTSTPRVNHYNDAVMQFFNERKWPFAVKKDTSLVTIADTETYNIPMTDWRTPGGVKLIQIGSTDYKPIEYDDRANSNYNQGNYFYINPENTTITFLKDITTAGTTITIYYYAIPTRQTDTSTGTFALLPDRYRKTVAYLAANFVLRGRHMNGEANDRLKLYTRDVQNASLQQSERTTNLPRTFGMFTKWAGFKRRYP